MGFVVFDEFTKKKKSCSQEDITDTFTEVTWVIKEILFWTKEKSNGNVTHKGPQYPLLVILTQTC